MTGTESAAHILIVDDDRLVLAMLGKGLRAAGYRVSEASDGETALRIAGREQPDLALLDIRMPDISGTGLAARLSDASGTPFMFLSAYGDPETIQEAAQLGALGYLVKPLDVPQIIPSIQAALARSAQIRSLKDTGEQLTHALETTREISIAIGIVMERERLARDEAYETLRGHARAERRKLQEVAVQLIESHEAVNRIARRR